LKKIFLVFMGMLAILGLLLTACAGPTKKGVVMVEYTSGQIKLAKGEAIVNPVGVEFRHEGMVIAPNAIPTDHWVDIVLVEEGGGGFYITTTGAEETKVKLIKNNGEKIEFTIKK
jgi:hypothetical protein